MTQERTFQIWGVVIFLALIIGITIVAALSSHGTTTTGTVGQMATTQPIGATDHVTGAKNGAVTVIEYGDFQCPACGAYEPLVEQLEAKYGDRVTFAFRNYPLPQHQDAMISAEAAEAAALQGKYWEMHDLIYKNQNDWSTATPDVALSKYFDEYAKTLGLDLTKFNSDVKSAGVLQKIQADQALGNEARVDHTPTFFVNATEIPNPQSGPAFEAVIQQALAAATTTTR